MPDRQGLSHGATSGVVESRDGTLLGYTRVGSGPAIVVCHGSFAGAIDWQAFADVLALDYTVYLYDRRGRGSSPSDLIGVAVDAEVDDLAAVMAIADPGAAVLGHSFGGGCVLSWAARDGFAGTVILYEPRHSIDGPVSAGTIPEIGRLLAGSGREAAVRSILENVIKLPPSAIETFVESPLWPRMLDTVDAFPTELELLDSLTWRSGDLDAITGPVWLVVGEDSPVLPTDREGALRGVLPDLRRVTLPAMGHFGYVTAPEALAAAVAQCLQNEEHRAR